MNAQKFLEAEIKNQTGSHAYLLIGNRKSADEAIDYIVGEKKILPVDISRVIPEELKGKAGEIKVEEIRQFLHDVSRTPQGKERLAIIYNAEKLNASSGNVLLKNLEEPVGAITFILVANSVSVLPTIKSRCRIINLASVEWDLENNTEEFVTELKKGFPEASKLIEKAVKEDAASAKGGASVSAGTSPDGGPPASEEMRGKVEDIIQELISNQRQKLLLKKEVIFAKNLEEIEKAKKKINQNGNQRLVLECLILKIGKNL